MFSDEITTALSKKLDPAFIKGRQQGTAKVQYVEGWYVIDLANRVFGFGNWHRETVFSNEVEQTEEPIRDKEGNFIDGAFRWRVSYVAKVRVTVGSVIREGTGAGHGIDRSLGQAHESAIKEAETDAMKRAFMTFGYAFGLALYDKDRQYVGIDEPPQDEVDSLNARDALLKVIAEKVTTLEATETVLTTGKRAAAYAVLLPQDKEAVDQALSKRKYELVKGDDGEGTTNE